MHWSWAESEGQHMIADLQGVVTDQEYLLTDPAIMSNSVSGGVYGCTDTGVEGIAMFFLKHTCNQYCRNLPRPTEEDVVRHLKPQMQDEVKAQISSLNTSTAYTHELKIPLSLRKRMISTFLSIATKHHVPQATAPVQPTGSSSLLPTTGNFWLQAASQFGPVRSARRFNQPLRFPPASRSRGRYNRLSTIQMALDQLGIMRPNTSSARRGWH